MRMITPDIDRAQSIPSMQADFTNRLLDNRALFRVELYRPVLEFLTLCSL
jgi:hypothetical protein